MAGTQKQELRTVREGQKEEAHRGVGSRDTGREEAAEPEGGWGDSRELLAAPSCYCPSGWTPPLPPVLPKVPLSLKTRPRLTATNIWASCYTHILLPWPWLTMTPLPNLCPPPAFPAAPALSTALLPALGMPKAPMEPLASWGASQSPFSHTGMWRGDNILTRSQVPTPRGSRASGTRHSSLSIEGKLRKSSGLGEVEHRRKGVWAPQVLFILFSCFRYTHTHTPQNGSC